MNRRIAPTIILLILVFMLSACLAQPAGDELPPAGPTPGEQRATAAPAAATPTAAVGGTSASATPTAAPDARATRAQPTHTPSPPRPSAPTVRAGAGAPKSAEREAALAALQALLDRQAQAALAHDAAGYLATFAPAARTDQQGSAEALAALPLAALEIELSSDQVHDSEIQRGQLYAVDAEVRYRWRGLPDDNLFSHTADYQFVREGEQWFVSAIRYKEEAPFWTLGAAQVTDTERFVLFAQADQAEEAATLAGELMAAYEAMAEHGLAAGGKNAIYLAPSDKAYRTLTDTNARGVGAVISRYKVDGESLRVVQAAMFLNGERLFRAGVTPAARTAVLAHELVHLALVDVSRPFTPPWLAEGLAEHYTRAVGEDAQRLVASGRLQSMDLLALTRPATLGSHDVLFRQEAGYEYLYATAVVDYLVQEYGQAAVLDFYRSYATVPVSRIEALLPAGLAITAPLGDDRLAGVREALTRDLLQASFGLTLAELDEAVKRRVSEGGPG